MKNESDLVRYLDEVILPREIEAAVFDALDPHERGDHYECRCPFCGEREAFAYKGSGWLNCNRKNKCAGKVSVQDYVFDPTGATRATGRDFLEAVRTLAELAGVSPPPERELSTEERERLEKYQSRRAVLEAVADYCARTLFEAAGKKAFDYLTRPRTTKDDPNCGRGFTEDEVRELEFGFYDSAARLRDFLQAKGNEWVRAAEEAKLLEKKFEGYVSVPWREKTGRDLLNVYFRWHEEDAKAAGKPKFQNPFGASKATPYLFDRAVRARVDELVAVEGVFDAALLQVRGEDPRVVAWVGSKPSKEQAEALQKAGIRRVILCGDRDKAGVKGSLDSVRTFSAARIETRVAVLPEEGMDPDDFFLRHGKAAWADLIARADSGPVHRAKAFLEGVTPDSGSAARRDAVDKVLDSLEGLHGPRAGLDRDEVLELLGARTGYDPETLAEMVVELDTERARDAERRERERLDKEIQAAAKALAENPTDENRDNLHERLEALRTFSRTFVSDPIRSVADELDDHERQLEQTRGKELLGLPQRRIPRLDEATSGLRGLMLLAAAPNVGKTVLAVQFGLDVVRHNPDAVFLFVSLEMARHEILTRMKQNLGKLDWETLVFGSPGMRGGPNGPWFKDMDLARYRKANEELRRIGDRIRILDSRNCPDVTVREIVRQVEDMKAKTGATRAFVAVDYLQVFPVPSTKARDLRSDLDADKWRISAMKEIRDRTGDAVLVIAEARKPSPSSGAGSRPSTTEKQTWGGDLADVMGSARGVYTPDIVFLFKDRRKQNVEDGTVKVEKRYGIARTPVALNIAKGRDGVRKEVLNLVFHWKENRIENDRTTENGDEFDPVEEQEEEEAFNASLQDDLSEDED